MNQEQWKKLTIEEKIQWSIREAIRKIKKAGKYTSEIEKQAVDIQAPKQKKSLFD